MYWYYQLFPNLERNYYMYYDIQMLVGFSYSDLSLLIQIEFVQLKVRTACPKDKWKVEIKWFSLLFRKETITFGNFHITCPMNKVEIQVIIKAGFSIHIYYCL